MHDAFKMMHEKEQNNEINWLKQFLKLLHPFFILRKFFQRKSLSIMTLEGSEVFLNVGILMFR